MVEDLSRAQMDELFKELHDDNDIIVHPSHTAFHLYESSCDLCIIKREHIVLKRRKRLMFLFHESIVNVKDQFSILRNMSNETTVNAALMGSFRNKVIIKGWYEANEIRLREVCQDSRQSFQMNYLNIVDPEESTIV